MKKSQRHEAELPFAKNNKMYNHDNDMKITDTTDKQHNYFLPK